MKRYLFQEMIEAQNVFDKAHGWFWGDSPENQSEYIGYAIVALVGELGELANEFKKWLREGGKGKLPQSLIAHFSEEMADIFIYLIKMASCLGLDLESLFYDKLKKNTERFQQFLKRRNE
ncbi:MAG: hypothetical protein ACFE89_09300 [Candidatus Hodarchaeota archaeon]